MGERGLKRCRVFRAYENEKYTPLPPPSGSGRVLACMDRVPDSYSSLRLSPSDVCNFELIVILVLEFVK